VWAPAFHVEQSRRAGRVQILMLISNKFRKRSSCTWFYVEGLKRSGPMTSIAKKSSFESSLLVKYASLQRFHVEHLRWGVGVEELNFSNRAAEMKGSTWNIANYKC
jgi:hypothetical protein